MKIWLACALCFVLSMFCYAPPVLGAPASSLSAAAAEKRVDNSDLEAAREERRQAADLYLRYTKATDMAEGQKLLLESRDILKGILAKYPNVEIAPGVVRNLEQIEQEIRTLDASLRTAAAAEARATDAEAQRLRSQLAGLQAQSRLMEAREQGLLGSRIPAKYPQGDNSALEAAREQRRQAADLYVGYTKTADIEAGKKLLFQSRDILKGILVKYPNVEIAPGVMRNLERIEQEIRALDESVAADLSHSNRKKDRNGRRRAAGLKQQSPKTAQEQQSKNSGAIAKKSKRESLPPAPAQQAKLNLKPTPVEQQVPPMAQSEKSSDIDKKRESPGENKQADTERIAKSEKSPDNHAIQEDKKSNDMFAQRTNPTIKTSAQEEDEYEKMFSPRERDKQDFRRRKEKLKRLSE